MFYIFYQLLLFLLLYQLIVLFITFASFNVISLETRSKLVIVSVLEYSQTIKSVLILDTSESIFYLIQ
jgi:hypothetical protein